MFEAPSAIENEQERSLRHSRNALRALLFSVLLLPMLAALTALIMWVANGAIDAELLLVASLLQAGGLALGLFFELRKYR